MHQHQEGNEVFKAVMPDAKIRREQHTQEVQTVAG
jgi:hypothetical protein